MPENEQNNYTQLFVQRQEQILIDYMRKCIALEAKEAMHLKAIQDIEAKYEESQKQVAIQNDMMQQATRSIEELTNKSARFENQINHLQNSFNDSSKKAKEATEENNNLKARNDSLQKEVQRLNQEINDLVKKQKEKELKIINKKKKEEPVNTPLPLEENTF